MNPTPNEQTGEPYYSDLLAEVERWKKKWIEDTTALEEERDALENFRKVAEAIFDGGFIGSDRARLDLMYGVWLNWKAR